MAGIEGVRILPGRGIMIAMNHRLVNTVVNRCQLPTDGDILVPIRTVSVIGTTDVHTEDPDDHSVLQEEVDAMLDDGEKLVPGFKRARAARLDRRAPALRGRQGRGDRHPRRDARAHDPRPRRARRRRALGHDHRRQAHDVPADGQGRPRRGLPAARRGAPVRDGVGGAAGLGGPRHVPPRRAPGAQGGPAALRAARLRVRADRARQARGGPAPPPDHEPRRHPPLAAPRHGPVPGRLLHPARDRDPARHRRPELRAGQQALLGFLQERWRGVWPILYGDQLRQARLDDWIFQGVLDVGHLPR
jgi:glycerol-3-phosphate dehydrogenase